ncbi:MAG: DUF1566 domain-containing protein [Spirochaetes bacterium]|nr:DUF1566 domain-containing protein [Spirochaetota bacterium]
MLVSCNAQDLLDSVEEEVQATTTAFPGTEKDVYWTSTEWTSLGAAVYVDFRDGSVNADEYPGNLYFVRCVANVDLGGTPQSDPQEFHSMYFSLSATGQEESFIEGDDGFYRNHLPSQQFKNNGDGTVTDLITGLVWTRCSLSSEGQVDSSSLCTGTHQRYEWADALNACLNLVYAGRDDWFLPTFAELVSLVNYHKANPAIR